MLVVSFFLVKEAVYDIRNLTPQTGVVLSTDTATDRYSGKESLILQLESDTTHFVVSRLVTYLHDNLKSGDSVRLYTKPVPFYGNTVADRGAAWTSKNPHEVFHLVLLSKQDVLIDFEENKKNLRTMAWVFPILGLLLISYFFYLRSGRRSPFVLSMGSVG